MIRFDRKSFRQDLQQSKFLKIRQKCRIHAKNKKVPEKLRCFFVSKTGENAKSVDLFLAEAIVSCHFMC